LTAVKENFSPAWLTALLDSPSALQNKYQQGVFNMTAEISVYLVGRESLLREGIKSLLVKNSFYIAGEYDGIGGMPPPETEKPQVQLIVGIDEETRDFSEKIYTLKTIYTKSRVVIISGRAAMPALMPALAAGIDALILKDISCDGLVGSLKLVAVGEKVYPTCMLSHLSGHSDLTAVNSNDDGRMSHGYADKVGHDYADKTGNGYTDKVGHIYADKTGNGSHPLSKQELKIVHCLTNGEPNKVIAQHLDITEATVKVHIKTILRKMGASNRTQAAIFAISQGISSMPQETVYSQRTYS
jgi:two-component system nitrate/nitrite response regulator NarL